MVSILVSVSTCECAWLWSVFPTNISLVLMMATVSWVAVSVLFHLLAGFLSVLFTLFPPSQLTSLSTLSVAFFLIFVTFF